MALHVKIRGLSFTLKDMENFWKPDWLKVMNLPAMHEIQETWVQSLGWEDPLEQEMQLAPVFLLGIFHGQRSLVGYSPWGHKELDTVE